MFYKLIKIYYSFLCFFLIFSIAYAGDINEKVRIVNQPFVSLKHTNYHLAFEKPQSKYENTFMVIRSCGEVVIDGITIIQKGSNFLAYHSILIEDCKKVTVKNSVFKGTCFYHLRIEGCEDVLVDNVEISGLDYGRKGTRCGGGIWINNGESRSNGKKGLWSENPFNLKRLIIRNCKLKNSLTSDKVQNLDGILIHSPSNGYMTDCIFENWLAGDAALDISHRRTDKEYTNKFFRVQRCAFKNNKHVKSTGKSNVSNSIIWINNIYSDTKIGSYHQGWHDRRYFESYLFNSTTSGFWRNWSNLGGIVQIRGCLLHVKNGTIFEMYKLSIRASTDAHKFIQPDFNIYSLQKKPKFWLNRHGSIEPKPINQITTFRSWRSIGKDSRSKLLLNSSKVIVVSKKGFEYPLYELLLDTSIPNIDIDVNEDFFGNPRDKFCYGAVCNDKRLP